MAAMRNQLYVEIKKETKDPKGQFLSMTWELPLRFFNFAPIVDLNSWNKKDRLRKFLRMRHENHQAI